MSSVRLNITLPEDVIRTLQKMAGPRELSAFIAESVRFYAKRKKHEDLKRLMAEGYQTTASENRALLEDFEKVDFEGWDED